MTRQHELGQIDQWIPYKRKQDEELLGFLAPSDGSFVPLTVFGHALGTPMDQDAAERVLDAVGLSCLAERWRFRTTEGESISIEIIEASPERVVIKNVDFGYEGQYGEQFVLPTPLEVGQLTPSP